MSMLEDDVMDFGDEDDGDFLTGKLAALGIDEDLELSGGEEECDDPNRTVTDRSSSTPASSSSNDNTNWRGLNGEHREPKGTPPNSMRTDENASTTAATAGDHGDDSGMSAAQRAPPPPPSSPSATKAQGEQEKDMEPGELETGELLQLLERPLQASRSNPPPPSQQQQQQQGASTKRASKRGHNRNRSSTSNNNGRAKGRNVTVKECAKWVCERLEEPKYYLMCQVVSEIGYNNSKRLLEEVRQTQAAGGMPTADGARKRTPGGVFFTLLKQHMEPARLKALYADEIHVKKEKERKRRAANKRKAEAADAGEEVTMMTPRNPPRTQQRQHVHSSRGGSTGVWTGPTYDSDAKRARAVGP